MNKISICKELMTWIFRATPNALKSYTMENMETRMLIKRNA